MIGLGGKEVTGGWWDHVCDTLSHVVRAHGGGGWGDLPTGPQGTPRTRSGRFDGGRRHLGRLGQELNSAVTSLRAVLVLRASRIDHFHWSIAWFHPLGGR